MLGRARRIGLLAAASAVVVPLPAIAQQSRHESGAARLTPTAGEDAAQQQVKRRDSRRAHKRARAKAHAHVKRHITHAAHDPGVTIVDFQFSPGSITIKVGDTITWSNSGPSAHSATGNNGTFDTGILQKGQNGSHTFSQAGTFAYFCSVHPFMKGTVTVQGSGGSSGSGSNSGSSSSGSTSTSGNGSQPTGTSASTGTNSSGGTLANTGYDSLLGLLTGVGLTAAGLGLRRHVAR